MGDYGKYRSAKPAGKGQVPQMKKLQQSRGTNVPRIVPQATERLASLGVGLRNLEQFDREIRDLVGGQVHHGDRRAVG